MRPLVRLQPGPASKRALCRPTALGGALPRPRTNQVADAPTSRQGCQMRKSFGFSSRRRRLAEDRANLAGQLVAAERLLKERDPSDRSSHHFRVCQCAGMSPEVAADPADYHRFYETSGRYHADRGLSSRGSLLLSRCFQAGGGHEFGSVDDGVSQHRSVRDLRTVVAEVSPLRRPKPQQPPSLARHGVSGLSWPAPAFRNDL